MHKVTLDDYSLSKYETSMADLDIYFQTLGTSYDQKFVQWQNDGKPLKRNSSEYEKLSAVFPTLPAATKSWEQAKN